MTEVIAAASMNGRKRLSADFVNTVNLSGRYGAGRGGHGLNILVKEASPDGSFKSWGIRPLRRQGGQCRPRRLPIRHARARPAAGVRLCLVVSEGSDPRNQANRLPTFAQTVEKLIGKIM